MKILFLCGYFEEELEKNIQQQAKSPVEYSANIFQEKLIKGFNKTNSDFSVKSAPFVGSFPNASKIIKFKGYNSTLINYVSFNNVWGFRNFSRAKALKKAVKKFISEKDNEKIIVVYSSHTPFLEAAVYAKKKDKNIKINLFVPDVPQFMNLSANKSFLYTIGKKYDIKRFNKLCNYVDSFALLTEQMKELLNVKDKPYFVVEGIVDEQQIAYKQKEIQNENDYKFIVYTGKMYENFGVKNLIDCFMKQTRSDIRLVLCGTGDLEKYVREMALVDERILYLGQVSPTEAREWQMKADVLVNPRMNDCEYTKYSFPSKNIEYILTGKKVVGFLLDGMKNEYKEFMFCVQEEDFFNVVLRAMDEKDNGQRYDKFLQYARTNLLNENISNTIIRYTK